MAIALFPAASENLPIATAFIPEALVCSPLAKEKSPILILSHCTPLANPALKALLLLSKKKRLSSVVPTLLLSDVLPNTKSSLAISVVF